MTLIRLFSIAKLDEFPTKYMSIPFDAYNIYRFSFSILFFGGVIWSAEWKCNEDTKNGLLVADCSNQYRDIDIPTNLNPNIQVLDLSHNKFIRCDKDSFTRYKNLISLDLSYSYTENMAIDPQCFVPLENLKSLNLSFTCVPQTRGADLYYYKFPATIRVFGFSNCSAFRMDLKSISALEEFDAPNSTFLDFPDFNQLAPLKFIDLRRSILTYLRPKHLAPFCLLEELRLEAAEGMGLQNPELYCDCVNVNLWLSIMELKYDKFNCTTDEPKPPACWADFNEENKIYEACLKRTGKSKRFSWKLLIVALLLVLLVPSTVLIFIFLRRRKSKEGETESGKAPSEAGDGNTRTSEENTPEETIQSEESEEETE